MVYVVYFIRKRRYRLTIMFVGVLLAGCCLISLVPATVSSPGTTGNIQEIFIGRCWEYIEVRTADPRPPAGIKCTDLWANFSRAWVGKDPTTIKQADYLPFFKAVKQPNIEKILLWSGTYAIAHEYSRHVAHFVTLEDSFLGYLVNGLSWCGEVCPEGKAANCPGINYKSCPDNLNNEAGRAFWGGASETFASSLKVNGEVQLMLNGGNPKRPAFDPTSYFALHELPYLPTTADIEIILVHDVDTTTREHCNTDSLIDLKKEIESRKFKFKCVENPRVVVHLLCADKPDNVKCTLPKLEIVFNSSTQPLSSLFKCLCLSIVFIYFTVFF